MTALDLTDGTVCWVPAKHHDSLVAMGPWRISYQPLSGGRVYEMITATVGGRAVNLGATILELDGQERPSPLHSSDHRDRNTRNNDLANLRWASREEQARNRELPASPVRLTADQWAALAGQREAGGISDSDLARIWKVSRRTIGMRLGPRKAAA